MSSLPHRPSIRVIGAICAGLLVLAACTSSDSNGGSDGGSGGDGPITVGSGDTYEATVRRTADGVPHITGATISDAAFGQGYASGQDRACDLADQVVKIRGERAKFYGAGEDDEHLNSDIQWRTIGIFDIASKDWEDVPEGSRAQFDAFAAGWNTHLEEVGVDGLAGWCAGEEWVRPVEPVEVYAYARAITLSASGSRIGSLIATAQPPIDVSDADAPASAQAPTSPSGPSGGVTAAPDGEIGALAEAPIASNGWAIGAERSADGGGMLLANPHFPWEGELRFWEVHLTVPGETNIYGSQLSGVPGIGIGFTEEFGWTHTVSAGNRFTAYQVDLVPGSPTTYQYGDETKEMTSTTHTIEVLGDDGEVTEIEHQSWSTHYGPVIDFPGFGWTEEATITYRDANIDNDDFVEQYFAMVQATSLDDFKQIHEDINGVPLFNTIAVSAEGEAWYADTSATPNLSNDALAAYETALETDPVTQIAADNGAILLDGSDPVYEWVDDPEARDPGLVAPADQPQVSRDDYVFNANDSFWVPHASEFIAGDYSPLHGRQETARSPRTRENATVLDDVTEDGASGTDGFTLDELASAALANRGYTSRALLEDVVDRCTNGPVVNVAELPNEDDNDRAGLPAGEVELAQACDVLANWDGVYDLDRAGPPLWREFMNQYEFSDFLDAGSLWAESFDPADPVGTPSGLSTTPDNAKTPNDPVLVSLARGVQALEIAGIAVDATLGETQFALRNGERIAIHGGTSRDGTTNIVGWGTPGSILDPTFDETERERLVINSGLATLDGETGYPINNGTSFLMALAYSDDGPEAKILHTYGDPEDRTAEAYTASTQAFSDKAWRTAAFTEEQVSADTQSTTTVKG